MVTDAEDTAMIELSGKVILVTGGSRGIGAAAVRRLVGCGAEVVIHFARRSDDAKALADEVGAGNVLLCQADLLDVEATESLWSRALAWRGHVDVLVNNAGIYEACPLDQPLDEWLACWERTLRLNLVSAAQLCRHAVAHFRQRGQGIVINVSSRAGHRGDSLDHLHYGASKAGMLALNRSIARNCASEGILAYGIAPGFVLTDMVQGIVAERGLESMSGMYPSGRITSPDEVACVITFLASGLAPQTTGNTIDLSGAADVR